MNHQNFFLTIFAAGVMALATGCSDDSSNGTNTGTGTSTSTGTGTGTGTGVELTPAAGGFVAKDSNPLGIQGPWYAYGDSIGPNGMPPGACQTAGMHPDAECAKVIAPTPGAPFEPTADGKMCTEGTVESVGTPPDYTNKWGAGIAFDFNNPGMNAPKGFFDADAAGVKGISFVIDTKPLAGLRVEFPDDKTINKGAAYWGATPMYATNSPVVDGLNSFTWDKVTSPDAATIPALNTKALAGIQFHVPTGATAGSYKFCISKITMLK